MLQKDARNFRSAGVRGSRILAVLPRTLRDFSQYACMCWFLASCAPCAHGPEVVYSTNQTYRNEIRISESDNLRYRRLAIDFFLKNSNIDISDQDRNKVCLKKISVSYGTIDDGRISYRIEVLDPKIYMPPWGIDINARNENDIRILRPE